jgi:hypothetical protein
LQREAAWAEGDAYSRKESRFRKAKRLSRDPPSAVSLNDEDEVPTIEGCEWEIEHRSIPNAMMAAVLNGPEQRVRDESDAGRWIYQSRIWFDDGKLSYWGSS